ncbi:hypothetical protein L195_g039101 [Trifolium pratense]|uniref:Uncharacterized protein n=1 Tax=Trifolium pratense TaxID=57577 RepID=A0A2K3LX10_TRIPR|nr:hypothetical protein L195_g039101 [Trifolium pratense]
MEECLPEHGHRWCIAVVSSCHVQNQTTQKALALPEKEVIQPHLPIRLPCYDFTPVTSPAFGISLLAVKVTTSGMASSHSVTGGVYKARADSRPQKYNTYRMLWKKQQ